MIYLVITAILILLAIVFILKSKYFFIKKIVLIILLLALVFCAYAVIFTMNFDRGMHEKRREQLMNEQYVP